MSVFIGYPSFMAYQMMKGNNDGFPSVPGMIARYSALGLTNEQMAANPVWKDLTGNGHDLQMKNFAWSGMSGVGGYVQKFNQYFVGVDESNKTVSDSSMKLVLLESDSQKVIYDRNSYQIGHTYNFYIKVTGIEGRMLNVNAGTLGGIVMSITEDGIYFINVTVSDRWGQNRLYLIFPPSSSSNTITIEQLPLYSGALVFDGVDDYGICDNFPVLTKEKGYTVVALRQWIEEKNDSTALVSNCKNWGQNGAFLFEYNNLRINFLNVAISFGHVSSVDRRKSPFSYQTSKLYNGKNIEPGSLIGSNELIVGKGNKDFPTFSKAAIWELVFLDHDATEEELTKIKDFVKTYPWLFFDQAWTVTGKTNEDEDRATIANITGNGNDLVLSNFGFIEGSGYNEEGQFTDGVDDKIASSAFKMGKDFTIVGDWKFIGNKKSDTGLVKGSSFYIYNTMMGLDLYINSGSVKNSLDGIKSINAACSDGRAYDRNWNEILANTGNVVGSGGTLEVSSSGGRFDRIAFKNLAIYPRILSKDDCIKAYNYLQTLKAK